MEGLPLYNQIRNRIKEGIERGIILPDENGIYPSPCLEIDIQEDTTFSNFPFLNLDGILLLSPISSDSIAKINERHIPYVSYNLLVYENTAWRISAENYNMDRFVNH